MNNTKKSIKIFLSYHRPTELLKNSIFEPIHVGRDIANTKLSKYDFDWMSVNMIGDNTGNNISSKNPNYCELTAQYWAWKNCQDDYIGFMHYRRHLNFNLNKKFQENKFGLIDADYLNNFYLQKFGLTENNIQRVVEKYDIVTVEPWDVTIVNSKNNYDHYASSDNKLHIEDYNCALEILATKYPEYKTDIEIYNNSKLGYYTNIFVMSRSVFEEYCSWLFDILFEVEKRVDISKYDFQEARIFGYISEWLFGIYLTHKKRTTKLKIKELQRTIVKNVDILCNDDGLNICFATDDNYIQHLSAAVASLLVNTQSSKNINIVILENGKSVSKTHKKKMLELSKLNSRANINFVRVDSSIFEKFPVNERFSEACFYRFVIPDLFMNLSKMIYLDCDLIVKEDIEKLYEINIENYYIAAVQDLVGYSNQKRLKINKEGKYFYCNSGVLLMNLDLLRRENVINKLNDYVQKHKNEIVWPDQDVINVVMEKKIKYLDLGWNLQYYMPDTIVDYDYTLFNKAIKNPKIIHFIGDVKPWHLKSNRPYSKEYFKYLKLTPWKKFAFKYFLKSKILSKFTNIFSVKKNTHTCITILGVHFKIKRKNYLMRREIKELKTQLLLLENKYVQLQNEFNKIKKL